MTMEINPIYNEYYSYMELKITTNKSVVEQKGSLKDIDMPFLKVLTDANVTYIYYNLNEKNIYVGQTKDFLKRHNQHISNNHFRKGNFDECIIIWNHNVNGNKKIESFGESEVKDLEYKLINFLLADKEESGFRLFNRNNGQAQKEYGTPEKRLLFEKNVFKHVWIEHLRPKGIVISKDFRYLTNKILFKYSPFKALTDEQSLFLKDVIESVYDKKVNRNYKVIGGAGTGKTVLLMALMYAAYNKSKEINRPIKIGLVTTSNLTDNFNDILKALEINELKFQFAGTFITNAREKKESYDLILVDESHRLQRYYSKGHDRSKLHFDRKNIDYNELEMLQDLTNNIVLFYDPYQSIRPQDIPYKKLQGQIRDFESLELKKQYRIKFNQNKYKIKTNKFSGDEYIQGLLYLLNLDDSDKFDKKSFEFNGKKDLNSYFGVVDSISELFDYVKTYSECVENTTNRVLAGYARKWISKKSLVKNKSIGPYNKFRKKLNIILQKMEVSGEIKEYNDFIENKATFINEYPKSEPSHIALYPYDWIEGNKAWYWNKGHKKWIHSKNSSNEIGCVHAIQGADLDYIGVIIGKDLMVENGKLKGNKKFYFDQGGTPNLVDFNEEEFTDMILHNYYILLTRGIEGCRVYFEDKEVEEYFLSKIAEGTK